MKLTLLKPLLRAFVARDLLQDGNRRRGEFIIQKAVDDVFIDEIDSIRRQDDDRMSGIEWSSHRGLLTARIICRRVA